MEDYNQLPIPDLGLTCPRCSYPLVGLPEHRCPECGTTFDVEELLGSWRRRRAPRFDGNELPIPDFGLHCPNCGEPLAGLQEHACGVCHRGFVMSDFRPRRDRFTIDRGLAHPVPLAGVRVLLAQDEIPYTDDSSRRADEIYMGSTDFGGRVIVPTDFYFDTLHLLRDTAKDMAANRAMNDQPQSCAQCNEEVPANFEVCWNCGAEMMTES